MGIIAWVVLGGLAGWVASMIVGNNAQQGVLGNIFVGIVGAVIGGFIVNIFGGVGVTGFNVWSFAVAVFGAVIALGIASAVRGGGKPIKK